METFHFLLHAGWKGGRFGVGTIKSHTLQTDVSIAADMGGPGVGTNPDDLLLAAAANCYMITLGAILERRTLGIDSFELTSEAVVTRDGGTLKFESIVHRPKLVLAEKTEANIELARQCAVRAERACMISQALRGNVDIRVEPVIE